MNLPTITVDPNEARKAFLEYRHAVNEAAQHEVHEFETRAERRRREIAENDAAIMRGYRLLARQKRVIILRDAIRAGGEDKQHRPKLAIARADEREIQMTRSRTGTVTYTPVVRWHQGELPARSATRWWRLEELLPPLAAVSSSVTARSLVPHIPPAIRPSALDRYAILWEADWKAVPTDPVLLRPLGQGLYAVLATWDLTPIERAVLEVR
jgi:hypothetical protein